jgi:hypothetical protein
MKKCPECGLHKPFSEFYKDKYRPDGLRNRCKACEKIRSKNWSTYNAHKRKIIDLRNKYGLTLEQFEDIKKQQNGKCAICADILDNAGKTHVDHCHKTEKVRGILCVQCNHGLGKFKDSIEILKSAQKYLKIFNEK